MITILLLTRADHISFKKRIIDTVLGLKEVKSNELPDHHGCRLGKWCDTVGVQDPRINGMTEFHKLADPHRLIHDHGKQALDHYWAGDHAAALISIRQMQTVSEVILELLTSMEVSVSKSFTIDDIL